MSTTRVNKIATVIIPVADQDGAVDLYVNKLGFEKRVDLPFGDRYRWVEVGLGAEATTIALAPPPEGAVTGKRETGISLQTDDIDCYHAQLRRRASTSTPRSAVWAIRCRRCSGSATRRATPSWSSSSRRSQPTRGCCDSRRHRPVRIRAGGTEAHHPGGGAPPHSPGHPARRAGHLLRRACVQG